MVQTTIAPAKSLKSVSGRWNLAIANDQHGKPFLASILGLISTVEQPKSREESSDSIAEKLRRIEAVLFLAREPISSRKLSQHASLADGTEARTLVRQLNNKLDGVGRAFRIEEIAGGFQFVTRQKFSPWLRRLAHIPQPQRLSTPALETLSVVAYRQPINRAEIESIRGVSCGEILNQLLSRDLVRICGRSEELGRPYLYGTSKRFLELFGLRSLDDLPQVGTIHEFVEDLEKNEGTVQNNSDCSQVSVPNSEEESGVSVSVELENHPQLVEEEIVRRSNVVDCDREIRMEDDDYDYEDDEEEEWDEEDIDEEDGDDELEDDELEDDELEDDELEDDEEYEDEEDDFDDEFEEEDDEDEEWEEVEDDEDEADDWDEDDDDWEDDEEWD